MTGEARIKRSTALYRDRFKHGRTIAVLSKHYRVSTTRIRYLLRRSDDWYEARIAAGKPVPAWIQEMKATSNAETTSRVASDSKPPPAPA